MISNSFSLNDLYLVKDDDGVFPVIPESFRGLESIRKTGISR
jgi:hypothetical protein